MRSATNSTAVDGTHGGFWHWNSPVAYFFVGLAFMLGLITVALIILACSYRKSLSSSSRSEAGDEKLAKHEEIQVDLEPKIAVIMAGDENPTYLLKPVNDRRGGSKMYFDAVSDRN
ncbi:hypothetical protein POTOM_054001 [Populus tomentosa]|uniref:Uncharacterized protein n=1 Tax=Populus tomentosa TaxID=118781 RepID=A0A8X7Y2W4_POPTO|nr:hypothetical protein POTOM_054001 [Populus tomentosa]